MPSGFARHLTKVICIGVIYSILFAHDPPWMIAPTAILCVLVWGLIFYPHLKLLSGWYHFDIRVDLEIVGIADPIFRVKYDQLCDLEFEKAGKIRDSIGKVFINRYAVFVSSADPHVLAILNLDSCVLRFISIAESSEGSDIVLMTSDGRDVEVSLSNYSVRCMPGLATESLHKEHIRNLIGRSIISNNDTCEMLERYYSHPVSAKILRIDAAAHLLVRSFILVFSCAVLGLLGWHRVPLAASFWLLFSIGYFLYQEDRRFILSSYRVRLS